MIYQAVIKNQYLSDFLDKWTKYIKLHEKEKNVKRIPYVLWKEI